MHYVTLELRADKFLIFIYGLLYVFKNCMGNWNWKEDNLNITSVIVRKDKLSFKWNWGQVIIQRLE